MIDTDKYEGHTEGLWKQYSLAAYHAVVLPSWKENIELILPKLADAKLIADAPLLLAEVKRLRAFIDKLYAKDPNFVDSVWKEGDPQRDYRGDEE